MVIQIHYLVPLLAAVIYTSLLLVISVHRPWQKQHTLFVMYLVAAAAWSFSDFLLRSPFLMDYKLLLFRAVIFASLWWVVQLYYFARSFLHLPGGWGIRFGYAALVLFGILEITGYAPPGITYHDGMVSPDYGWWFIVYLASMSPLGGLGVYSLIQRLRNLTDPKERNKVAYLIGAIGMLVVFGFAGVTPLAREFPVSHIGGLLSACILTYATMKHELVSLNSVLRRGLGWASLVVLGAGTYVLVFYILHLLVDFELKLISLSLATLAAAVAAGVVYRLRHTFLGMVDQLFYRETYSYRRVLLSFSNKMGSIINLKELADEMLPIISKALRIPQARLLLEDTNIGDFTTRFAYPRVKVKSSDALSFGLDSPIVTWLEKETGPLYLKQIDNIPQFKGLWQREREKLAASGLELLCPIKSRGKLIGILALSGKQLDAIYSQEDVELLISMTNQAGIVIENARMFDSLKKQQRQMEQLLAQAVLAQEEERERISADLHDSVAQWLVAASYQAQTASHLLAGNGNNNVALGELTDVEDTINKSVKELRRVVVGLRPPALDELGLTQALRRSLDDLKTDGLIGKFSELGTPLRLSSEVEIAIYRVVQEALNNVRKHANATRVNIRLEFGEDKLLVEVRDNGRGFDLSQILDSAIAVGHLGLLGMRQRVEMLGGDIKIKTSEGAGTTITLGFPVQSPVEKR